MAGPTTLPQKNTDMNTLSIRKEEKASMAQVARKWWNARNALFSAFTGESFTNKEVVLAHLILISLLIGIGSAETYPFVAALMMGVCAVLVKQLNKTAGGNHKY